MTCWRDMARPIIAAVIARCGDDEGRLKRELFDAYPWGERRYHPYRIWLDEIRVQRGLKKARRRGGCQKATVHSPGLFDVQEGK